MRLLIFYVLFSIPFYLSISGCDVLGCSGYCPEDIRQDESLVNEYQIGDTKKYINIFLDTLTFTCDTVILFEGQGLLGAREENCCPKYFIEDLIHSFKTESGISMKFDYRGNYFQNYSMSFFENGPTCDLYEKNSEQFESIVLVGQEFENGVKKYCDSTGYSIYFGSPGKIIGFTIDSVEYALVQ